MSQTIEQLQAELQAVRKELDNVKYAVDASTKGRSVFLHYMCHDIRNQLTAVLGFSDFIISEKFGKIDNPKYREYVRDIRTGAQHVVALADKILDIVWQEAGKLTLQEVLIDIDAFVRETLPLVPRAKGGRVQPQWHSGASLPRLHCDPVRLRQILLNVVGNAVKFTNSVPGGRVDITVDLSEGLTFVVNDTGIGIKPEDIARVLTPFEQVQAAYSPNVERGLGLGLPLAKALTEAHGGTLALESMPGVGTTVRLMFPSERVHPGVTPEFGQPAPLGTAAAGTGIDIPSTGALKTGRGRILIVEDETLPAKFFRDVLQAHGYNTRLAMSGGAALSLAGESRPDLILMDIRLYDNLWTPPAAR